MPTELNPSKPASTHSTQSALPITEVKDGVAVMQDGSLRAVILASAINFDLMSPQEQDAVEYSFQGFLNSLHFPVQILIKSQKIDLDNYLEKLSKLQQEQDNPLLADLMEDYIQNIKALVEEVNIMDKQFFVVVPFFPPLAVTKTNLFASLANIFKPVKVISVGATEFDQYKSELAQRVQQVAGSLVQMGVRAIPLNTQELIDLFYAAYNPDVAPNQKLIDSTQFQSAAVTRGERPAGSLPAQPAVTSVNEALTAAPSDQAAGQPTVATEVPASPVAEALSAATANQPAAPKEPTSPPAPPHDGGPK